MGEIKMVLPSDIDVIDGLENMKMSVQRTVGNFINATSDAIQVFKPKIKITKEEITAKFNTLYTIPKEKLIEIIDLLGDRDYYLTFGDKKLTLTVKR